MLSLLILLPAITALIIFLQGTRRSARVLSLIALFSNLLLSSYIVWQFNTEQTRLQFVEQGLGWFKVYHLAVDGLSLLFLPLVTLVFLSLTLIAWQQIRQQGRLQPHLFFSLLLLQCSSYLGIFLAQNTLLFSFFWLLSIFPTYKLIRIMSHTERQHKAAKSSLGLMLLSSLILLLVSLITAYITSTSVFPQAFAFYHLNQNVYSHFLFLLVFLAFAIRIPLFPFQYCITSIAKHSSLHALVLFAGIPIGLYGLLRFIPFFPQSIEAFQIPLMLWATISIIYGLSMAWRQSNLRLILSYLSMSYFSVVVLGLLSLTLQGIQGALIQTLSLLLALSGLFMLLQLLYQRTGSCEIKSLGSLQQRLPLLSLFYLLFILALLGIPSSASFVAQLLMIKGLFSEQLWIAIIMLMLWLISSIILLKHYSRSFAGGLNFRAEKTKLSPTMDLRAHESILIVSLSVLFLMGLYPQTILDMIRAVSELWFCQIKMGL